MTASVAADGKKVYWRYGRSSRKADGEVEFRSSYLTVDDAEQLRARLGQEWLDKYLVEGKQKIDEWAERRHEQAESGSKEEPQLEAKRT